MEPDDVSEPATDAADRRDNRTAVIVAVSAAIVVGIASAILMANAAHAPGAATPTPTHSLVGSQSLAHSGE